MANLLRERHRTALQDLIKKVVTCPKEDAAIIEAYAKAAPLVRACVEVEYPVKDMKILKRYDVAEQKDSIGLRLTSGGDTKFKFEDGTGPLVPDHRYGKMFLADEATTDAVHDWEAATRKRQEVFEKKRSDYLALVGSARTLEEVEAVWDEAAAIRPMFEKNQTALSVLTPEVIKRIKADVKARQVSA